MKGKRMSARIPARISAKIPARILALLAAVALLASLAACGQGNSGPAATEASATSAQSAATTAASGQTEASAAATEQSAAPATETSAAATSAQTTAPAPATEPDPYAESVDLAWYMSRSEPPNVDSVFAAINKITKDKINTTVTMNFVEPADYNQKMSLVMGSGEVYDLAFTCSWTNNYVSNVANKAYIPIDEYMTDEYMPDILSAIPDYVWKGITLQGKVYALPNYQAMAAQYGLVFPKELVDKYELADRIANIKTQDDLKDLLLAMKSNEPDMYPIHAFIGVHDDVNEAGDILYEDIGVSYFLFDDMAGKVIFRGDSTRYINQYKTAREWYELGLLPEDATIMNNAVDLLKEKKIFAETQNARPGYLEICQNAYGYEFVGVPLLEKAVGTGNVQGTLTGVSITSENPARAVQFYNLLYSDKELYNTLVYGIEGQDYAHTDADHVDRIQDQYVQSAWQVGNSFNAYLLTGQAADLVEQTIEFNSSAKMGKMLGFSPDVAAIQAEVAAVQGIAQEYDTILANGLSADVDGTLAEYRDKVFASGGQAIIDELQKQVDAYLAGQ